jgi:hypothetical protein
MAHLSDTLPPQVEQGAMRSLDYGSEIVTTDGGYEVRNNRWDGPKRIFEVSFPTAKRSDDPVYIAVKALYEKAEGGRHSFNFRDWTDPGAGTIVAVRFDSALKITGLDRNLDHIETLVLREVFT